MAVTTARPQAIHIGHAGLDGQVVLHSGDDRFMVTFQQAINACGAWLKVGAFEAQMKALMARLGAWVADRRGAVRGGYLSAKAGGGLFFMVVTAGTAYDPETEDALTDLDIEVANSPDYDMIRMSVLAIPDCPAECVDSFLTGC